MIGGEWKKGKTLSEQRSIERWVGTWYLYYGGRWSCLRKTWIGRETRKKLGQAGVMHYAGIERRLKPLEEKTPRPDIERRKPTDPQQSLG